MIMMACIECIDCKVCSARIDGKVKHSYEEGGQEKEAMACVSWRCRAAGQRIHSCVFIA